MEAAQARAAGEVQEHGLRHVVGRVPGRHDPGPPGDLPREPVPRVARPLLQVGRLTEVQGPHLASDTELLAERQHEICVGFGFPPAQAVVHLQDGRLPAEVQDRPQQGDGVGAAGDERERAREVHPVPVRGPPHALYEVVMRHTSSLGERPARVAAARKRPGLRAPAPCCERACGV